MHSSHCTFCLRLFLHTHYGSSSEPSPSPVHEEDTNALDSYSTVVTAVLHVFMLTLFLITTVLAPYGLYHVLAHFLHWTDRRLKTPVQHTNTLVAACVLGTTLYYVGGYDVSFHPVITVPVTIAMTAGYGQLSELAPLRTSLRYYRTWSFVMWSVVSSAVTLILVFAVFHVRYALTAYGPMVAWAGYVGSFVLLPLTTALLVFGIYALEKQRSRRGDDVGVDDFELVVGDEEERELMRDAEDAHSLGGNSSDEDDTQETAVPKRLSNGLDDQEAQSQESQDTQQESGAQENGAQEMRTIPPRPIRHVGAVKIHHVLRIHLHHYQIFAYLALFTRFPTIWSRCAAGLAIGCMMHGIAAYGVDSLFEFEEEKA